MRTVPLVLVALLLAGCGAGRTKDNAKDFTGAEKPVAQVVDDLAEYGRKGDADRICKSVLAAPVRKRLEVGRTHTCAAAVSDQLDDADAYALDVQDVTVTGATATARVNGSESGGERVRTLRFVREGRAWRLRGLG